MCALVTGVQTCALPVLLPPAGEGARRADGGARAQRSVLLVFLTGAQGQRAARSARPSSDASRHLLPQAGEGLGSGLCAASENFSSSTLRISCSPVPCSADSRKPSFAVPCTCSGV